MVILSIMAATVLPIASATINDYPRSPDFVDVDMSRQIAYGGWYQAQTNDQIQVTNEWDWNNAQYTYMTTITWSYPTGLTGPTKVLTEYIVPQTGSPQQYLVYIFLNCQAGFYIVPEMSFGSTGNTVTKLNYYSTNAPSINSELITSDGYLVSYTGGSYSDWSACFTFRLTASSDPTIMTHWQGTAYWGDTALTQIVRPNYTPSSSQDARSHYNGLNPLAHWAPSI